jgi:DNA topoisomerase-1
MASAKTTKKKPAPAKATSKSSPKATAAVTAEASEDKVTAKPSRAETASKAKAAPASAKKAAPATKAPAKKAPAKKPAAKKPAKKPAKAKAKADEDDDTDAKPVARSRRSGAVETALVVVESPAKARTIKKYLGPNFQVLASVGHVKDLPKSKIGVDIEHDFQPEYVPIRGKGKVITEIKKAARNADIVYLAPDPDREGEAIAWHIAEEIRDANPNIKRVLFNEITKRGITEAMAHPTELNHQMFDAQQARRILDRLVGYQISPILWTKVRRGLSAGRVQSVAVRIVVERETEITAFKSEEYWTVEALVEGKSKPAFTLRLHRVDGQKPERLPGVDAQQIAALVKQSPLTVGNIEAKVRRKLPAAPFITSKLQQEGARKLRFTAKRTMGIAQRLYEGVELGVEGLVGLITYMRTDSTRISPDALTEVRGFIEQRYGKSSLPDEPNVYKSKSGNVQDAHEAIRPTSMKYDPETVRRLLTEEAQRHPDKEKDLADQVKLYQLIWNRFVASQMTPAVYDLTNVAVEVKQAGHVYDLRATGQVLRTPGFTAVYTESQDEDRPPAAADGDGDGVRLPALTQGEPLRLHNVQADQHFTQPPPRFTEASLIKELEEKGIGRPSTYAAILSTIADRGYVEKKEGRFFPTLLGTRVNDLLVQSFPEIVSVDFTAKMEADLDFIEEGNENWLALLKRFYPPFKGHLERAQVEMKDWKREEIPTEFICEKCGKPLVIKWGRNGEFLACSGYPECKNTKEFIRDKDGRIELKPEPTTEDVCPKCGSPLVFRRGRFGEFWACSKYPDCKTTKPVSLGITCPKPGCGGFLTEKRSRRGSSFYGCSNYSTTKCDFVSWDRPVKELCPDCGAPFLLQKQTRRGPKLHCATCKFVSEVDADDAPELPDDSSGSGSDGGDEAAEG